MIDLKSEVIDGLTYHTVKGTGKDMVVGIGPYSNYKVGDMFETYPGEYGRITEIIVTGRGYDLVVLRIPWFEDCIEVIYIYPETGTPIASTTHSLLKDGIVTAFNLPKSNDFHSTIKETETISTELQPKHTIEYLNDIYKTILEAGFICAEFKATDKDGCEHIFNYRSPKGN